MNTDASILVYKFRPERTGFNMNAEYTRLQGCKARKVISEVYTSLVLQCTVSGR